MIETHIYNALVSSTAITRVVGTSVFPLMLSENQTLPAIVYRLISSVSDPTFETSGMTRYRVEIACFGSSYSQVVTLRDDVISTLDGYQDAYMSCFSASTHDQYDHDLTQYIASIDFFVLSTL